MTLLLPACSLLLTAASVGTLPRRDPAALADLRARIGRLAGSAGTAAGVAIVDADGPVWVGAVGEASPGIAADAGTLFRAASIAKNVTAVALMRFVDEGRLSLDVRMRDLAPEVEFDNPWEATNPLRLAHVLEHTSGFDDSRFNEQWNLSGRPMPLSDVLRLNAASRKLRWPPGTAMSYSNENYLVAGYLVEKLAGRPYQDAVRELVFGPLHMTTASFDLPAAGWALAQGHQHGKAIPDERQLISSSVGLIASARDLAQYLSLWIGRGATGDEKLLSRKSVERIESCRTLPWQAPDQCYGIGNDIDQVDGVVAHGHSGIYDGFVASLRYAVEERLGWAVLMNAQDLATKAAVEREIVRFALPRRSRAPARALVRAPEEVLRWEGLYRPITTANALFAPVFATLEGMKIARLDGGLREWSIADGGIFRKLRFAADSHALIATEVDQFRHAGETVASRRFVTTQDGRTLLVTPVATFRKVSAISFWLPRAALVLTVAVLRVSPWLALLWMCAVRILTGRISRAAVRMLGRAGIAAASFSALYELLVRSPQRWGHPNATTITAFLLSAAFPILTVYALVSAVRAPWRGDVWVRSVSLALCCFAGCMVAFFAHAGWIGIRLWSW